MLSTRLQKNHNYCLNVNINKLPPFSIFYFQGNLALCSPKLPRGTSYCTALVDGIWLWTLPYSYMYIAGTSRQWYDQVKTWKHWKMLSARRMVGYLGRKESFVALRSTVCKMRTLIGRRTVMIWCAR